MLSFPAGAAEDEDDDEVADGSLVELLLVEPLGEALIVPLAEPLIEPLGAAESVLEELLVEPLGYALLDVLGAVVLPDVPGDVVLLLLPGDVELVLESVDVVLDELLDDVLEPLGAVAPEPLGDVALDVPLVASGREALGSPGEAAPAVAVSVAGAAPVELVCA